MALQKHSHLPQHFSIPSGSMDLYILRLFKCLLTCCSSHRHKSFLLLIFPLVTGPWGTFAIKKRRKKGINSSIFMYFLTISPTPFSSGLLFSFFFL